jgi:hypothetical protein
MGDYEADLKAILKSGNVWQIGHQTDKLVFFPERRPRRFRVAQ